MSGYLEPGYCSAHLPGGQLKCGAFKFRFSYIRDRAFLVELTYDFLNFAPNNHLGFTLKWLAIHCHLPLRFIQVSVKRPRRSHDLPLSTPFS